MTASGESGNCYRIRAVAPALELLEAFAIGEPEVSLAELSGRQGMNGSTLFRLLATLRGRCYIEQSRDNGRYRLGTACVKARLAALGDELSHNCFFRHELLKPKVAQS